MYGFILTNMVFLKILYHIDIKKMQKVAQYSALSTHFIFSEIAEIGLRECVRGLADNHKNKVMLSNERAIRL